MKIILGFSLISLVFFASCTASPAASSSSSVASTPSPAASPLINYPGGTYTNTNFLSILLTCVSYNANVQWSTNNGASWITGTNVIISNDTTLLAQSVGMPYWSASAIITNTFIFCIFNVIGYTNVLTNYSNAGPYNWVNGSNYYLSNNYISNAVESIVASGTNSVITNISTNYQTNFLDNVVTNITGWLIFNIPTGCTVYQVYSYYGTATNGTVVIPATYSGVDVTSVCEDTFRGCSGITSVTLPSTITNIGSYAFLCCYGLTNLIINATNPPSINNGMLCGDSLTSIQVPAGSVLAYQTNTNWSEYSNIIVSQ